MVKKVSIESKLARSTFYLYWRELVPVRFGEFQALEDSKYFHIPKIFTTLEIFMQFLLGYFLNVTLM